jgi:hypothetical protein
MAIAGSNASTLRYRHWDPFDYWQQRVSYREESVLVYEYFQEEMVSKESSYSAENPAPIRSHVRDCRLNDSSACIKESH